MGHLSDQFLRETYGRGRHLFTGDIFGVAGSVTWADVNATLENHWHDPRVVRLISDGRPVLVNEYVKPRRWRGKLELVDFYDQIAKGASLVVEDPAAWQPALRRLARLLEHDLHEPVETQLFVNGPSASGFGVHWDPYDVFAVQLLGQRSWKLYPPTREAPLLIDKASAPYPDETRPEQVDLVEGDVLYLPRGWWHDAGGADEPSVHATIVVPKRTGADFISWLDEEIRSDPAARRDIPRFGDEKQFEDYAAALRKLVVDNITPGRISEFLVWEDASADGSTQFSFPLALDWKSARLEGTRVVNLVPRAHLVPTDSGLQLLADGTSYVFESNVGGALVVIFGNTEIAAAEILEVSGLSVDELLALIEELQRNGLVATGSG